MSLLVSVVVPVRDGQFCVGRCIKSILNQTFKEFELIMVDDESKDRTPEIIKGFKDPRISYIRNQKWLGIAGSRNSGVRQAKGKYVFFTDADCKVNDTWIEEGLRYFEKGCVGVEGRIVYVSEDYERSFSDYVMDNPDGGQYMTGNVAYLRDLVLKVGGLEESLKYLSDRALGLSIIKYGSICFNRNMVATHPWVQMTPKRLFNAASSIEDRIFLTKKFGDKARLSGHIMSAHNLLLLLAPELIFGSFLIHPYRRKEDVRLLPYTYIAAIVERIHIWKASIRNHMFII